MNRQTLRNWGIQSMVMVVSERHKEPGFASKIRDQVLTNVYFAPNPDSLERTLVEYK